MSETKYCPYCGEENNVLDEKCKFCGELLEEIKSEVEEQARTKNCPYCGEEIRINAKKCKHCGEWLKDTETEIEEQPKTKNCPFCGEEILSIANKCKHCGETLSTNNPNNHVRQSANMPKELEKYNWGAFFMAWIWGLCNGMPTNIIVITIVLCILSYVPIIDFVAAPFALGLLIWNGTQGNKWAWAHNNRGSVEKFNEYQKKWVFWPLIITGAFILIAVVAAVGIALLSSY